MNWTDERLDNLNGKVDRIEQRLEDLRREMHTEFRAVRSETKSEFKAIRGEMSSRFDSVQNQMAAMQRSMNLLTITILGGFITLFTTMLGVIATALA